MQSLNKIPRILYKQNNGSKNVLFIVIACMHGNEIAGVEAIQNVAIKLSQNTGITNGTFLALTGNKQAFKSGKRFIDTDLNRLWTDKDIKNSNIKQTAEHLELFELNNIIQNEIKLGYKKVVLLDLHTTSANGGIFLLSPIHSRDFTILKNLYAPVIDGLVNNLTGTAIAYFNKQNCQTLAFEAGQHNSPDAIINMEAIIWLMLHSYQMLNNSYDSIIENQKSILKTACKDLPHICTIKYRHQINDTMNFKMKIGYTNFQEIDKGEHLADENNKKVLSGFKGRILMPLYQTQGSDGFFIINEIND